MKDKTKIIKASNLEKNWGEDLIKRGVFDNPEQEEISKIEKAFGGCKNCYGKGYHTTIEYASGRGEWDMGQRDIKIHYKLPEMRFCNCDRGKELKKRFDSLEKETRQNTLKEIEATTKEMAKMIEKVYMKFDREDFCEEPNSICPGCNGCKTYEELSKLFIKLHKKSLVG